MNLSPDDDDVLEVRHVQHEYRTLFWATMPLPPSPPAIIHLVSHL